MSEQHRVARELEYDYFRVHNRLVDEFLAVMGAPAYIVYTVFARLVDSNQSCFPGLKYLERTTGYSRNTIIKAIRTLEEMHLVRVERRMSDTGDAEVNTYVLLQLPEPILSASAGGSASSEPPDKKVVESVNYPVQPVNYGSAVSEPGVVQPVNTTKTQSYKDSITKTTTTKPAASAPTDVVVASAALLLSSLQAEDIPPKVARKLLDQYGEAAICQQLAWLPQRQHDPERGTRGGLLRKAIEEGWGAPATKKALPRPKVRQSVHQALQRPPEATAEDVEAMRAVVQQARQKIRIGNGAGAG